MRQTVVKKLVVPATLAAALFGATPVWAAFPGGNGLIVFQSSARPCPPCSAAQNLYTLNTKTHALVNIGNSSATQAEPAVSPNGKKVAFASNADGDFEIYVMPIGGGSATQLTHNTNVDRQPTWSPDGTKIAFSTDRDGNFEIYSMNADGSSPTDLTNSAAADIMPAWSPDGTKIAFISGQPRTNGTGIYLMNANGTSPTFLTATSSPTGDPNWSPDSKQITFRDGLDIWKVKATGGVPTNLTNAAVDMVNDNPAWSPDAKQITFYSDRTGNADIYVMKASDGSGQTDLINDSAAQRWPIDQAPDWQPTGALSAIGVADFAFSPSTVSLPALSSRVQWNFAGPSAHTATDHTGLGLYDSGARTPPYTFWQTFKFAGQYSFFCSIHTFMTGTVKVPMKLAPSSGGTSTSFTVTWATGSPPASDVFDVQIKRPGSTSFVAWMSGVTAKSATFVPDAGVGTYSFEARLRNTGTGAASGFSAPKSISVS